MRTFIYDYLQNPSQAIAEARKRAYAKFWNDEFTEDKIYAELSSPEFRLYEEISLFEEPLSEHGQIDSPIPPCVATV